MGIVAHVNQVPCTMPSPCLFCLTVPPVSSVGICFRFHVSNLRYRSDFNLISLRDSNAHENILTVPPPLTVRLQTFLDVFPYHITQRSHIIHTISNENGSLVSQLHRKCMILRVFQEVGHNEPGARTERL